MSGAIHPTALEQPAFAELLGLSVVEASLERVVAELRATPALINRNGVLHGGAIMGLADNMGGTAAFLHLGPGQGTTTLESKTNFFRAVPAGDLVRAVTEALHIGRKTMIFQTKIFRADGKLAAMVTQTQLTLMGRD